MTIKQTYTLLLAALLAIGCSMESDKGTATEQGYQAISVLGDTLYAPEIDPETEAQFKSNLQSAKAQYEANPNDADAIIWYGRRTAYLGNYRKAVDIFSEGVEKHPNDARMYRHRGHRYITLREFDKAIEDLEKAADLIAGTEDMIEPDGLPNIRNMPRSTLHTNIWYHLGLARYLTGDFGTAADAYRNCMEASTNDDMMVATSYWLYMTLKRAGNDGMAGEVLEPIRQDMDLLENESYLKLLLVFKGDFDEKSLLDNTATPLDNATVGYGIGNWHYVNGRNARAEEIFREVYQGTNWAAFGYIAAEVDLAKLF
ncbi:MAG TPA: tetratricopeptide repeat protein [Halalkalibaculum sp.]|nr:tetratricopeptide repeat protein [Halalkalibaculum sp.]